ncbi:response regulator transcription factor [Spirosoma pulveris]
MRILIVEDEIKLALSLKRGLEECGFETTVALDGAAARRILALGDVTLMLLDIGLPDVDGLTLCREMRRHYAQIPVIMLTALGSLDDKLAGFDVGASDYVVKPFAFGELLARIRVWQKRATTASGVEAANLLTIADLVMNVAERRVSRAGQPINLAPRELALLLYLLRHPGVIISRQQIAEHVWDIPVDSGTNLIDVYINSLRKKIDRNFPVKLIHTRKGIGYMLTISQEA